MSIELEDSSAMKALIEGSAREEDNSELIDEPEDTTKQTCLQNRYSFWFHRRGHQANKVTSYEETILKIATFQTVEHFWRIYDHIIRPNEVKTSTDYHVFKDGVKPTWEDPVNRNGGKWMVRVKKGLTSMYWEDLLLAIIGEQFDVGHEICGAVVSVRNDNDIISVWNKNADNMEATNKIRDQIRRILKLPTSVAIEYKKHQESLTDNSSYRNPSIVWRASTDSNNANFNRNNGHYRTFQGNSNEHRQGFQNSQGNSQNRAPPGVQAPRENSNKEAPKSNAPSRWDALKDTSPSQPATQNKGWRQPSQGHTNSAWGQKSEGSTSAISGGSWGSTKSHSGEIKIERESSSESAGFTTASENGDNSKQTPVESEVKGKNIGGWFKSQLSRSQSDSSTASTASAPQAASEGSPQNAIPSAPPVPPAPKPSAWRTPNPAAQAPPIAPSNIAPKKSEAPAEAPRWGRGSSIKKE